MSRLMRDIDRAHGDTPVSAPLRYSNLNCPSCSEALVLQIRQSVTVLEGAPSFAHIPSREPQFPSTAGQVRPGSEQVGHATHPETWARSAADAGTSDRPPPTEDLAVQAAATPRRSPRRAVAATDVSRDVRQERPAPHTGPESPRSVSRQPPVRIRDVDSGPSEEAHDSRMHGQTTVHPVVDEGADADTDDAEIEEASDVVPRRRKPGRDRMPKHAVAALQIGRAYMSSWAVARPDDVASLDIRSVSALDEHVDAEQAAALRATVAVTRARNRQTRAARPARQSVVTRGSQRQRAGKRREPVRTERGSQRQARTTWTRSGVSMHTAPTGMLLMPTRGTPPAALAEHAGERLRDDGRVPSSVLHGTEIFDADDAMSESRH